MSYNVIAFSIALFLVSVASDIVLHRIVFLKNSNRVLKSLRPYYKKYGEVLSPIFAAITVLIVYFINVSIFYVFRQSIYPKSLVETIEFIVSAIILGICADIIIDKFRVFGNTLSIYYTLPFSYAWGFIAYLFALFWAYLLTLVIYNI
jgi:hypothetical protein